MRIAILGLGSIGARHKNNLIALGEKDLFGYDPRVGDGSLPVDHSHVQLTNEIQMVWDWKPEVAVICAPPKEHHELARVAMFHGAHVFCEKPLCLSSDGAEVLATKARTNGRHLAVGYQIRFSLKEFYGLALGYDLSMLCAQDMATWPSRYDKDPLAEFSHEVASATFLKGPVEAVTAQHTPGIWNLSLRHLKGYTDISMEYASKASTRLYRASNGQTYTWALAENNRAYRTEMRAFLSVCQGAPWDDRLCSGAEAVHITRILDAARESDREFSVVQL